MCIPDRTGGEVKEAIRMATLKMAMAGVILGGSLGLLGAPVGHTDPFTPAEQQFLNDVRARQQSYGDPRTISMSDADLVAQGWQACRYLAAHDSAQRHGINPLVGTYASLDLCHYG
jgi:hypothetical protein